LGIAGQQMVPENPPSKVNECKRLFSPIEQRETLGYGDTARGFPSIQGPSDGLLSHKEKTAPKANIAITYK
jgi:hypothetical protein